MTNSNRKTYVSRCAAPAPVYPKNRMSYGVVNVMADDRHGSWTCSAPCILQYLQSRREAACKSPTPCPRCPSAVLEQKSYTFRADTSIMVNCSNAFVSCSSDSGGGKSGSPSPRGCEGRQLHHLALVSLLSPVTSPSRYLDALCQFETPGEVYGENENSQLPPPR